MLKFGCRMNFTKFPFKVADPITICAKALYFIAPLKVSPSVKTAISFAFYLMT